MNKKIINLILSIMFVFNIVGCGITSNEETTGDVFIIQEKGVHESSHAESANSTEGSTEKVSTPDYGVWYPYWDYDTATQEMDQLGNRLNTICFFAAYFDVNGKAFIPEDTKNTFTELTKSGKLHGKTTYLTFVNDKLLKKGSSLKDTDLLYDLIGDSKKAMAHADEAIALCKNLGCDGLEIDYEAIKKDKILWEHYNEFVTILAEKAKNQGLSLRIVFEPSAPISEYNWPSSCEYVMMCYNLNGYGTNPGPKANIEWLRSLAEKMNNIPGSSNMALANGGFDFSSSGEIKQINYQDAKDLISKYSATSKRDSSSAAMSFTYTDENGINHEVWYADEETIETWINTVSNCGINRVTIWRLGGNL